LNDGVNLEKNPPYLQKSDLETSYVLRVRFSCDREDGLYAGRLSDVLGPEENMAVA